MLLGRVIGYRLSCTSFSGSHCSPLRHHGWTNRSFPPFPLPFMGAFCIWMELPTTFSPEHWPPLKAQILSLPRTWERLQRETVIGRLPSWDCLSFVSSTVSILLYLAVALMWLVPDKRFMRN